MLPKAAGVSRQTVYRWRQEDFEFAEAWDEAHENAVDVVENVIYQQAAGGNTLAAFFYLKAHRPIYWDRVNIDITQVQSDIDEMMERFRENPGLSLIAPQDRATLTREKGGVSEIISCSETNMLVRGSSKETQLD